MQNLLISHFWLSAEGKRKTQQLFIAEKISIDRTEGGQTKETCKQTNETLNRYISNYSNAYTNNDECFCYFTDG